MQVRTTLTAAALGAALAGTAMLATGVVFGVSSIVGFHRTRHCRAAQREAAQRAR
jgi:hypothetical protein